MGRQDRPMQEPVPINAERWLTQIFAAKAADGQVVRRNVDWVAREIGTARFEAAVQARGFHLIRTADQFIVVCHRGEIRLLF